MVRIARVSALVLAALTIEAAASSAPAGATAKTHRPPGTVQSAQSCTSTSYDLTIALTSTTNQTTTVPVSGEVDFSSSAATADVTIPANFPVSALAGTTEDIVIVGGTLYASVPPSWSGFVGGASWIYVSLPKAVEAGVTTLGRSLAGWCGKPSSIVSFLEAHGGSASSLGTSLIDGTQSTGTQVKIAARRLTPLARVVERFDPRIASQAGGATVVVDVWSNAQNQLTELSATATGLGGGTGLDQVAITLDLSNIGQPVTISAPTGAVKLSTQDLKALSRILG